MTEPRLFTLAEATATLPLVRPIVDDLRDAFDRLTAAGESWRQVGRQSPMGRALEDDVDALAEMCRDLLEELQALGVDYIVDRSVAVWPWDYSDRRALVEEREGCSRPSPLWLTWRPGEPAIAYWSPTTQTHDGPRVDTEHRFRIAQTVGT